MLSSLCCFNISRSLASLHARGAFDTEDCCRGYGRQAHNTAEIPTNKHRKEKNTQYKSGRRRRDAWRRTHLPTDSLSIRSMSYWTERYLLTGSPFSITDFSFGAGGTLPTHAFTALPPTLTVHVPQSPFLQLVLTLIPSFLHAAIMELPAAT